MLAEVSDYEKRYGTPSDETQVNVLLADADSLVYEYVGTTFNTTTPDWVTGIVCGMVNRAVSVPAGVKSVSFVDAFTESYADSGGGTGVYLTNDEFAMLVGGVIA